MNVTTACISSWSFIAQRAFFTYMSLLKTHKPVRHGEWAFLLMFIGEESEVQRTVLVYEGHS